MQAFLIVVAIVVCGIFLVVDLYLLAIYSHKEETNLSAVNIFCKCLIMLTLFQIQLQPLFLILDVANNQSGGQSLTIFWVILYSSILANIAILKPLAISLYERDHQSNCCKNVLWSSLQVILTVAFFAIIMSIGWLLCSYTTVPVEVVTIAADSDGVFEGISSILQSSGGLSTQTNLTCFMVAFFCILGYPILACCGAFGLTALPISLILEFVNRPRFRRTTDARKISEFLREETLRLLRETDRLGRDAVRVDEVDGFFARRQVASKFQKELKELQKELEEQRDLYELFKLQLQMEKVNPLVYVGKLLGGILGSIVGVLFWLQILFTQENGYGSIFLDRFFVFLEDQNANFVAVGILMAIAVYMTCCIIRGAVFFSNSIPFIRIHPIIQGRTWLNSFLFQLVLCVFSAASLLQMLTKTFPYYLSGGDIVYILNQLVSNLTYIGFLLQKKVFIYWFLGTTFLGIIYVIYRMICASQSKGPLLQRIQAMRIKLFGKDGQNKSIQMVNLVKKEPKGQQKSKSKPKIIKSVGK